MELTKNCKDCDKLEKEGTCPVMDLHEAALAIMKYAGVPVKIEKFGINHELEDRLKGNVTEEDLKNSVDLVLSDPSIEGLFLRTTHLVETLAESVRLAYMVMKSQTANKEGNDDLGNTPAIGNC